MVRIRLITFDITGTLLQVKHPVGIQYAETLKRLVNIDSDPASITKSFNRVFKLHEEVYPIFGKIDGFTTKVWWRSVFVNTLVESGALEPSIYCLSSKNVNGKSLGLWQIDRNPSPIEQAFEILYDNFEYKALPHTLTILKFLRENFNDISLGAISNSDERILTVLEQVGLRQYFDFAVASTECGFEKPDKRFFEYALKIAAQKLNIFISPQAVIHIGDSFKEDYQGAIDAGFSSAFLLDPKNELVDVDPDHRAKDLADVMQKLKKIIFD